jgi:hypothetical protein
LTSVLYAEFEDLWGAPFPLSRFSFDVNRPVRLYIGAHVRQPGKHRTL